MNRSENLERVRERREPWDIVVIGGGATGVGCALDAATRGLSVLLLEQHDFGKGTSSRSTKLVHGGVRYLAQGNIKLVREALKERGILLRNAPHVVHKQAFIVPCYSLWQKFFYGVGLKIYDLLAGKYSFGKSRILSKSETAERLETVKTDGLAGGVLYYDGQFDDTRLLIDMAVAANTSGACLVNYAAVEDLLDDDWGTINGVKFRDVETGEVHKVPAKIVINAAGAFCDPIRRMADREAKPLITFAQGSHIVLDRRFLASDVALMIPNTSDGRVLFCIPWLDHVIVGTTDTPVTTAELEPKALDSEIDFILETVGEYLSKRPTRDDILSSFAGIRPLVSTEKVQNTAALSRSHELFLDSNLITITGGKWTTYRRMAQEAVDAAVERGHLDAGECVTEDLRIAPPAADESYSELLHPELPYTHGDVFRAIDDEMARTVEDVLARRTRALFLNAQAAVECADTAAEMIAAANQQSKYDPGTDVVRFEAVAKGYLGNQSSSENQS